MESGNEGRFLFLMFRIVWFQEYRTQGGTQCQGVQSGQTDSDRHRLGGGVRPALKGRLPDVGAYDVIFVGSPCWWSTVAPPVATFLADCDWAGKTVVPFMTHEGSRMGRSEEDIRKLCAGATLLGGLPLRGGAVKDSRDAVRKWVQGLNLTK